MDVFYQCGVKSFLKKGKKVGGEETAYIHTLKYYIPDIVDITYFRHRAGVRVFTMQGVSFNFVSYTFNLFYALNVLKV